MGGTTAENSFLQFTDLVMLILTLGILIAFLYFVFNVVNIDIPPSVKNIFQMIGSNADKLGDVPKKIDITNF